MTESFNVTDLFLVDKVAARLSFVQISTDELVHLKTAELDERGKKRGERGIHLTSNISPIKIKITKLKTMSAWF